MKLVKSIILALFVFQAWFSQAWLYPQSFAEWRVERAVTAYLAKSGQSVEAIQIHSLYEGEYKPRLRTIGEIYGSGTTRWFTWLFWINPNECDLTAFIAPSGEIHLGTFDGMITPATSFDTMVYGEGSCNAGTYE